MGNLNVSLVGQQERSSMQRIRSAIFAATAITVSAISLGGCATKDYVNEQVATANAKTQATQNQVDQQQTHLGKLDQDTQDALNRATAAGKLAEGKFLYSMVLSDDSVKFPVDSSKLSPEADQRLTDFAWPKPIVTEELGVKIVERVAHGALNDALAIDIHYRRQNLRHSQNSWFRSRIGLCKTRR